MISSPQLLKDLQRRVTLLEEDLRRRCDADSQVNAPLQRQYEAARASKRTAETFNAWRDEQITQIAVAWVLACVFVRFLEDNQLLDTPFLAGPDAARMNRARDEQELFFKQHPTASERDYLLHVFDAVGQLPGMREFFDRRHNPLWLAGPTGDALASLLDFWRKTNPDTGALIHDFSDPRVSSLSVPGGEGEGRGEVGVNTLHSALSTLNSPDPTRFLGDLYQDLSESARKRYALLQTPEFVEQFILDRTLTPAIDTFGYRVVRMLDMTCGSGHFLLGGFDRLFKLWQENDPGENPRVLAQRALDQVCGVDLNPNVVAIARFRLLLAALKACQPLPDAPPLKLKDAPDFKIHLAVGDSLLHGARFHPEEKQAQQQTFGGDELFRDELQHFYDTEDRDTLHRILGRQYHVVVGNPPYITVKDKALNQLYRDRFDSCHRKYSLAAPFMERFFDFAIQGEPAMKWDPFASQRETPREPKPEPREPKPAGYVGLITANSFMKREFGSKLIEECIPRWDLTHVIDTSGAYIPGHGTPTVILFGKHQPPVAATIRTVMGIKGEPATPQDPARGLVWSAILCQLDQPGSESEWVSVADTLRQTFHRHPWSIGGGGAADLKEAIEEGAEATLESVVEVIGVFGMTNADDIMLAPISAFFRRGVESELARRIVAGDEVRDWVIWDGGAEASLFPYVAGKLIRPTSFPGFLEWTWPGRTVLGVRATFEKETYFEAGRPWWQWHQIALDRLELGGLIAFANIATHNHFSRASRELAYNVTAQIITLKPGQVVDDEITFCGVLNSSTATFWLKQVCFPKGGSGIGRGIQNEAWESRFAFDGTKLKQFPVSAEKPLAQARDLDRLAQELKAHAPDAVLRYAAAQGVSLRDAIATAHEQWTDLLQHIIALQEELDWECYRIYGLLDSNQYSVISGAVSGRTGASPTHSLNADLLITDDLPPLKLGERAFEIVMARKMGQGELQTAWFERHGSTPITELPAHWPAAYRALVERRLALIARDRNIALIEQPEYKRRWNTEPWDDQQERALRQWLLNRLEGYFFEAERMIENRPHLTPALSPPTESGEGEPAASLSATNAAQPLDPADRARRDSLSPPRGEGRGEGCREADDPLADLRASWPAGQKPTLISTNQLAELVQADAAFLKVAEVYVGTPGFSVPKLVRKLVEAESVPFLPFQRYKESGLRKRRDWERTWELQRQEDAIDALEKVDEPGIPDAERQRLQAEASARKKAEIGEIPVPPKYTSADFKSSTFWRLRGKLDVPKERWISYPDAERDGDPSPVIAWAGWNHLQQAQALAEYYITAKDTWGWSAERLILLLAGLADLLPWLKQWHNELNPEYGMGLGDYFAGFLDEEFRKNGTTVEQADRLRGGAVF